MENWGLTNRKVFVIMEVKWVLKFHNEEYMNAIRSESITKFRDTYKTVLQQVKREPVLLLQNSQVAAVLVDPEQWNNIAAQLDRLQGLVWSLQADLDVANGKDKIVDFDPSDWGDEDAEAQGVEEARSALHLAA
jgi:PHD/YefM family antitoxin component YafN of YafNO toxin-antitoxin module